MFRRLRRVFSVLPLVLCISCAAGVACLAQDTFPIGDIAAFDGKTWAGLTIGQSSTADIKKTYKTSKGAIRPEAMLLPQPENSRIRVDVLTNGRGEESVLSGFRLAYADNGPDLASLTNALKVQPETWYPREHFDDWRIVSFPDRGIVVLVEGTGPTERVSMALLCSPMKVRDVVETCDKQASPPRDIHEAFPDDKRVVEISRPHVFITVGKGITLDKSGEVSSELERRIIRLRMPSEVVVQDGSKGLWFVRLDLSFSGKDKKATLNASSDMSGVTMLGKVAAASHLSDSFDERADKPVWSGADKLERTAIEAAERVIREMARTVRNQPLPTPSALRAKAFDSMMDKATR